MGHPLLLLLAALAPGIPSPLPQPAGERLAALFPPSALQTDIVSVPFLTTEMVQALPLGSTRVAPGSVEVVRDGIPLREGRDFAVDLATGVVHLTQPTPPATALTVRYRLGPRAAAPALQRPNPARSVRTARLHYLFGSAPSPTSRPGAGVRISTLREQSQSGLRLQEFRDEMRQGKGDQGAVSYRRTEALDPRTAQAAREEVTTRVDVQPDPGTRLRVNQSVSREGLFTSGYREQEQSRVQWDRVLGRSTASLLWEQNRALGPQLANARDLFSLGVTHPFSRRTTVAGTFSTEDSLFRGRETGGLVTLRQLVGSAADLQVTAQQRVSQFSGSTLETGATLTARPRKGAEVRLGVRQSDSAKYGRFRRVSAETQWQLHPRVQVSGEVGHRSADEAPGIFTYGLGLAARPTSTVLFEASQQQGVTQSTARERNRLVRVTAQPSSVFRAQLGFQDNALEEPDRLAATRNALWNFQAGGNRRYVKLDGHSGLVTRPGQDPYLESLYRVEVRPAGAFSLFTSLREVEQKDAGHSLLGLGTTLFLRKGVEVTATHRQPGEDTGGKNDAAGQGLQLKLAPSGSLKLFGGYNFRPEDPRGALLDETHQTLGLETQVGSVALLGSMTYLDRPTSVASEQRWDLLATLSLGDATRLFAGYRTREGGLADRVFGRSYRFGVSQGVGTSFFLLLEGEVGYAFDPAGARSLDPDSTRAQARFGLKF